ncbi:hypothetical protein GSI_14306 [Ganoderma sinense ZZ0214-1]|uniref:Uncharacterized protein n=1 Tax=Ganoderma sinense ZZ0214-1 TaxID=1077348 RepID=A0A2G8RNA8_9APHY|nr:hypothetical protein GSI_14306 [Ganoderma sinense ZZ0214-1]
MYAIRILHLQTSNAQRIPLDRVCDLGAFSLEPPSPLHSLAMIPRPRHCRERLHRFHQALLHQGLDEEVLLDLYTHLGLQAVILAQARGPHPGATTPPVSTRARDRHHGPLEGGDGGREAVHERTDVEVFEGALRECERCAARLGALEAGLWPRAGDACGIGGIDLDGAVGVVHTDRHSAALGPVGVHTHMHVAARLRSAGGGV